MTKPLEDEFNFFVANQDDLVRKYRGKFVVIKGQKVLGAYETQEDAIQEALKEHPLGTFLVQQCVPGSENYTQTFHSRVALA